MAPRASWCVYPFLSQEDEDDVSAEHLTPAASREKRSEGRGVRSADLESLAEYDTFGYHRYVVTVRAGLVLSGKAVKGAELSSPVPTLY